VRIFFIISGYLITRLLIDEQRSHGRISLTMFYLRRTLRIFPALYFFILAIMWANAAGLVSVSRPDFLAAVTYTINYKYSTVWELGHLWSLAVEEQFYLLWPVAIVALGLNRALKVACAVVLAAPLVRIFTLVLVPSQRLIIGHPFQTIADPLAVGCLLAGLRGWLANLPSYQDFLQSKTFYILVPLTLLLNWLPGTKVNMLATQTLINFCIVVCIDRWVNYPTGIGGWFLNLAPLRFIGVLSYSLYIWQQLFLNRNRQESWTTFPVNLALAFAAALLSYYLVERPFLDLRRRIEKAVLRTKPKVPQPQSFSRPSRSLAWRWTLALREKPSTSADCRFRRGGSARPTGSEARTDSAYVADVERGQLRVGAWPMRAQELIEPASDAEQDGLDLFVGGRAHGCEAQSAALSHEHAVGDDAVKVDVEERPTTIPRRRR